MRKRISWPKESLAKMAPETLNAWLAEAQGWTVSQSGYDQDPCWRDADGKDTGFSPDPYSGGTSYYSPTKSYVQVFWTLKNLGKKYRIEIKKEFKTEINERTGEPRLGMKTGVIGWLDGDQGAVYETFDGADPLTLSLAILWAVGKIDESRG